MALTNSWPDAGSSRPAVAAFVPMRPQRRARSTLTGGLRETEQPPHCGRRCCVGLAASTLARGQHDWFLPAMRKRGLDRRATPGFASLAVLQAASCSDLKCAETTSRHPIRGYRPASGLGQSRDPRIARLAAPARRCPCRHGCRCCGDAEATIRAAAAALTARCKRGHRPGSGAAYRLLLTQSAGLASRRRVW
jgi:hypothetical protein